MFLFFVQIVNQFESMVKEEVKIDPRVHSMIIGKRGRTIHKIMDDFKVKKTKMIFHGVSNSHGILLQKIVPTIKFRMQFDTLYWMHF